MVSCYFFLTVVPCWQRINTLMYLLLSPSFSRPAALLFPLITSNHVEVVYLSCFSKLTSALVNMSLLSCKRASWVFDVYVVWTFLKLKVIFHHVFHVSSLWKHVNAPFYVEITPEAANYSVWHCVLLILLIMFIDFITVWIYTTGVCYLSLPYFKVLKYKLFV